MPEADKDRMRAIIAAVLGLAEEIHLGPRSVAHSDAVRVAAFAWNATELERLRETIEDEAAIMRVRSVMSG